MTVTRAAPHIDVLVGALDEPAPAFGVLGDSVVTAASAKELIARGVDVVLFAPQRVDEAALRELSAASVACLVLGSWASVSAHIDSLIIDSVAPTAPIPEVLHRARMLGTLARITRTNIIPRAPQLVSAERDTDCGQSAAAEVWALQEELAKARVEYASALASGHARAVFFASINHEIRTPMNAVLGYAQALERSQLPADEMRMLTSLKTAAHHLLELVNDALDISKLDASKMQLSPAPYNLRSLLLPIRDMFSMRCRERGLALDAEFGFAASTVVLVDKQKFTQVLLNLLSNAAKFTREGGVRLSVIRVAAHRFRILVEDTGIGLSVEEIDRLFQPFVQVRTTAATEGTEGTGLGLAIVRGLVTLMGGHVALEPGAQRGLVAIVDLPLEETYDAPTSSGKLAREYLHIVRETPLRALVVDDIAHNREVLRLALENVGAVVLCAEDGEQALEVVETFAPDVVFMDLSMPRLDGVAAVKACRERYPDRAITYIAVSASSEQTGADLSQVGFSCKLTKPINFNDIYRRLERYAGVRFVYVDTDETTPLAADLNAIHLKLMQQIGVLSDDERERLTRAASMGEVSTVRDIAGAIRRRPDMDELSAQLEIKLASYDLEAIAALFGQE